MTRVTKAQLIDELTEWEGTAEDVLRLGRLTLAELRAELKRRISAARARYRAWEEATCSCGKKNKDCGEITHGITLIEPWPTPFTLAAPKVASPRKYHSWLEDELK